MLDTFKGTDGSFPTGSLVRDSAGNLYGTTSGGGTGGCDGYGCGTAFKMNKQGKEVWLYSLKGTNEIDPTAGLLRDASGNLYGTTENGGKAMKTCGGGKEGFVMPVAVTIRKTPTVPPHTTMPEETDTEVLEQIPTQTTVPVESIVALFPAVSEKRNAGGVCARD